MTSFKVVIPARYASTRLPGKPLLDIAGKPMVLHVAERAARSGAEEIVIATDHEGIAQAVASAGYQVVMTSPNHPSGTDRLAEVVKLKNWQANDIIVNVQGDEPLIDPQLIRQAARDLTEHPDAAISTLCHVIHDPALIFDSNTVKVVMDAQGYALYFSRAPIPYLREYYSKNRPPPADMASYRHIGLYAYRASFLTGYMQLAPAPIEQYESLEQLRALWHGYKISVAIAEGAPAGGVDTIEDLEKLRALLQAS